MKKAVSLCLALLMALAMAAAPGLAEEQASSKLVDEPVTLTCAVQASSKIIDISTNEMTKWMEEQTGIHIDWTVLEQDAAETVSLMLNSGEQLPDIMMVNLTYDQQYLYGQQGILMNLSPLIEQYAPNITKTFEEYPLYAATSTRPDGNVYYVSAYEECFHCTAGKKMWVNTEWMDRLGLEMPKTTEEFKQMLIAFRDQDANGNGDAADEIPLSSFSDNTLDYLLCAFIYSDGEHRMVVEDGKVSPAYTDDAFREGLKYLNDLFKEGLIDENIFVQDSSTFMALTTGEVSRVGAVPTMHTAQICPVDNPNIYQYEALEPLTGPEGVSYCPYIPNAAKTSDGAALSASCSNPEAAIKWLDFLFTEEATIRSQYGVRGVDWEYNDDPNVLGLNNEQALFHTFGKNPVFQMSQMNEAWEHTSPFCWVDYIFAGQAVLGGGSYDLEKVLYDETHKYVSHFPEEYCTKLSFDTEDASYIASVQGPINDFVKQSIAEYTLGTRDIHDGADWADYIATLEAMDLTNYVATMQKGYDAQQEIIKNLK